MRVIAHVRKHRGTYRGISLFLAIAFTLGFLWGTNPLWQLAPTIAFGAIVAAQEKRTTISGIAAAAYVLALAPTIFLSMNA